MKKDINIEPTVFWCARHIEPFRERWPNGYLPATLWLLHRALEDGRLLMEAEATKAPLEVLLPAHRPICCFLGDVPVASVTKRALSSDRAVVRQLAYEVAARAGIAPTQRERPDEAK